MSRKVAWLSTKTFVDIDKRKEPPEFPQEVQNRQTKTLPGQILNSRGYNTDKQIRCLKLTKKKGTVKQIEESTSVLPGLIILNFGFAVTDRGNLDLELC